MDLRGSVIVATCMETLVYSTHCVHNRQSFHTTKSYLRNNILCGTPGHKGHSEKALTVLETARISVKDKKWYTQKRRISVSCTGKIKELENVVSDRI